MDIRQTNNLAALEFLRFRDGAWHTGNDSVAREVAVTITWKDAAQGLSGSNILWAWAHDLEELTLGNTLLEHVASYDASLQPVGSVTAKAPLSYAITVLQQKHPAPFPPKNLSAPALLEAMRYFINAPGLWEETGCFHRAAVFAPDENALCKRVEDIARHNCLDRLVGWSASSGTPLADKVLLTSARITASYCTKALRAGFRALVSRGAVTSAAIEQAQKTNATLIGFARPDENRFTVFADTAKRFVPTEGAGHA